MRVYKGIAVYKRSGSIQKKKKNSIPWFSNSDFCEIDASDACPICKRAKAISFHHLIPIEVQRKEKIPYEKRKLRNSGISICQFCHDDIHKRFSNHHLAVELYEKESLINAMREWAFGKQDILTSKPHELDGDLTSPPVIQTSISGD